MLVSVRDITRTKNSLGMMQPKKLKSEDICIMQPVYGETEGAQNQDLKRQVFDTFGIKIEVYEVRKQPQVLPSPRFAGHYC